MSQVSELFSQRLSDRDFDRIVRLVHDTVGIHLPPHKRGMVELRVAKRARVLGIQRLDDYCSFVFDGGGASVERVSLIDALTTNKTDFFREPEHFHCLVDTAIPALKALYPDMGGRRPMRLWSAGCATGEEPYSIAMALWGYAQRHPGFDYEVYATDVSASAIRHAVRAVYPEQRVCSVPIELRRHCLLRNKDHSLELVRIAPDVRTHVGFARHNLFASTPPNGDDFDVIFCRNVIIYFERETQIQVLAQMVRSLVPGGYLFVGHSETLHGMPLPLERTGPTVYRRTAQ